MTEIDRDSIDRALERLGLISAGERPMIEPLTGGVSCDVFRVDLASGPVCVKRALPKLKVEKDWFAPVERNEYEVAWLQVAGEIVPEAVPKVLGEDRQEGLFAMPFLAPESHPVWKKQLRDGVIDPAIAGRLGAIMARIHAATADRPDLAERFSAAAPLFHALRIEPYFLATAAEHPDVGEAIEALAARTAGMARALVHGDFSPKNILIGPHGPILLDAEACTYGDPAFDLAFCLNHMLLKGIWRPQWVESYLACYDAMAAAYLAGVTWEPAADVEARIASLLPVMLLARIDGKSPVEYITEDADRDRVRAVAKPLLLSSPTTLAAVRDAWAKGIRR